MGEETSMARKIVRLKREARAAATYRGHTMGRFVFDGVRYWDSECRCCYMKAYVTGSPQPNEIEVSGEAVALNCPYPEPLEEGENEWVTTSGCNN